MFQVKSINLNCILISRERILVDFSFSLESLTCHFYINNNQQPASGMKHQLEEASNEWSKRVSAWEIFLRFLNFSVCSLPKTMAEC